MSNCVLRPEKESRKQKESRSKRMLERIVVGTTIVKNIRIFPFIHFTSKMGIPVFAKSGEEVLITQQYWYPRKQTGDWT